VLCCDVIREEGSEGSIVEIDSRCGGFQMALGAAFTISFLDLFIILFEACFIRRTAPLH
jgi:hypothetical protein